MSRALRLMVSVAAFTLSACGAVSPGAASLPSSINTAQPVVPAPNEAYPTSQASESNASQTVGGFSVDLQTAWREGKQVHADVCFTLPDDSDWTVWAAHFDYPGEAISEFSSSLESKTPASAGAPARRCDALTFSVPPDADLSAASLTIESLGAYPTADEYCSLYMPKIQATLHERGIDIALDCAEANGATTMRIVSKPDSMSQEEAEKLVYSDEFYTVRGPWTFSATFAP